MRKYIILFTVLIVLISCKKEAIINESNIRIDRALIVELNSKSCDTLKIEANSFVLDAYLWKLNEKIYPKV